MYQLDGHERTYTLYIQQNKTAIEMIKKSKENNEGIIGLYLGNHYNKDDVVVYIKYLYLFVLECKINSSRQCYNSLHHNIWNYTNSNVKNEYY